MPIKEREGEEFDLWVRRIRKLGYKVEWRELVAADYGAPTTRKRLYLIARRDGKPIVWPEPTHGKRGSEAVERGELLPWRSAAECIDWSIPCPSIFTRKRPLKPNTLKRIAHGTMRYVVEAARPFIVPVTHAGGPGRVYSSKQPFNTVTGANRGEMAVVVPHVTKFRGGAIGSDSGEPMPTVTANGNPKRPAGAQPLALASATMVQVGYGEREGQAPRALDVEAPLGTVVAGGSKHAAVMAFLSAAYTSNTDGGRSKPELPLKTVMAGGTHHAVVCAHIEQANGGPRNGKLAGRAASEPFSTVTGTGSQQRVVQTTLIEEGDLPPEQLESAVRVAAFLVTYYGTDQAPEITEPLATVTTKDRFAVVTVTIDAVTYVIVDIGMRMLTPRELARAQGFPDHYVLDPIGPKGRPLSKSAQIRMIGNSVCPDVATALVRANLADAIAERAAA